MYGGTPSNISLSFLEEKKIEVITGVNLPMLLKLATYRNDMDLETLAVFITGLRAKEHQSCERGPEEKGGKEEGMIRPVESQTFTIRNRLGLHARAAALLVKTANRFERT